MSLACFRLRAIVAPDSLVVSPATCYIQRKRSRCQIGRCSQYLLCLALLTFVVFLAGGVALSFNVFKWLDNRAWLKRGRVGREVTTNYTPWQDFARYIVERLFDGILLRALAAFLACCALKILGVI